jgi:hypothetical protein
MKKINIKPYIIEIFSEEGVKELDFNVKDSLANLIFSLKHGGREFLLDCKIAKKIMESEEDSILLEEAEYKKILEAADKWQDWSKNHEELVKRIYEAEDVKIKEAK